jgi:hypothetical protein
VQTYSVVCAVVAAVLDNKLPTAHDEVGAPVPTNHAAVPGYVVNLEVPPCPPNPGTVSPSAYSASVPLGTVVLVRLS